MRMRPDRTIGAEHPAGSAVWVTRLGILPSAKERPHPAHPKPCHTTRTNGRHPSVQSKDSSPWNRFL